MCLDPSDANFDVIQILHILAASVDAEESWQSISIPEKHFFQKPLSPLPKEVSSCPEGLASWIPTDCKSNLHLYLLLAPESPETWHHIDMDKLWKMQESGRQGNPTEVECCESLPVESCLNPARFEHMKEANWWAARYRHTRGTSFTATCHLLPKDYDGYVREGPLQQKIRRELISRQVRTFPCTLTHYNPCQHVYMLSNEYISDLTKTTVHMRLPKACKLV